MSEVPVSGEAVATTTCSNCGAGNDPGSRFCEACGFRLVATAEPHVPVPAGPTDASGAVGGAAGAAPGAGRPAGAETGAGATEGAGDEDPLTKAAEAPEPCATCGGRIAADGYCEECGTPAPLPVPERDHWAEEPSPTVAGVCDRGIRHRRNEDAMALAAGDAVGGASVLVVCDGVSSSRDSDIASLAAAKAARDVLIAGLPTTDPVDWPARLTEAAAAAQAGAVGNGDEDPTAGQGEGLAYSVAPSCTLVIGVLDGRRIHVGNVGDSRAYWLPDSGVALQLSRDDSWAAEQIAMGVPVEEAESGPRGHAITRWLGADSPGHDPRPVAFDVPADVSGWLMVCSDGLWNYCSKAADLQALVLGQTAGGVREPAALAAVLVDWANAQGGRDNITVTLARVERADAEGGA